MNINIDKIIGKKIEAITGKNGEVIFTLDDNTIFITKIIWNDHAHKVWVELKEYSYGY
jgi:hypothetical protein